MNPVRRAAVVAFMDWVRRTHPNVTSLCKLSKEQFMQLAVGFETSKGLSIDPNHDVYRKWESTQYTWSRAENDSEALEEFRG